MAANNANISGGLNGLPDEVLPNVVKYLDTPLLLAVALTAPSTSWQKYKWNINPSETSMSRKVLLNTSWEELDFVRFGKDVSSRLTDTDLGAILKCINAKDVLKVLRLTYCSNIIGDGLAPLSQSVVLQELDASIIPREEKKVGISENTNDTIALTYSGTFHNVIRSIFQSRGSRLKRLTLPEPWKEVYKPPFAGTCYAGCKKCDMQWGETPNFDDEDSFPLVLLTSADMMLECEGCSTVGRKVYTCNKPHCKAVVCKKCNDFYCEDCMDMELSAFTECMGCGGMFCKLGSFLCFFFVICSNTYTHIAPLILRW